MMATPKFKGIRKLESTNFQKQKKTTQTFLLLMEEILHQLIGTLSHVLQGFIHPNGGWPWDFWTINSRERFFTTINMNHPTLKLVWPTEILSLLGVLPLNSLSKKKNWKKNFKVAASDLKCYCSNGFFIASASSLYKEILIPKPIHGDVTQNLPWHLSSLAIMMLNHSFFSQPTRVFSGNGSSTNSMMS